MTWIMEKIGWFLGWIMLGCYKLIPSYAVAIVLFTLITKGLLFPLSIKQQKNTAVMARLRPKIDAINKQYKKNPQKQQLELQKLYEKEGYSPYGGCLPLLIQLPIIYGLIDVVYRPLTHIMRISKSSIDAAVDIVKSLGVEKIDKMRREIIILKHFNETPEKFSELGAEVTRKMSEVDLNLFGVINLGENPTFGWNWLILIPILSLITAFLASYITTKISSSVQGNSMNGMAKGMLFTMPLISTYFSFMVPAGVGFYWIISNIFSAVQSILLNKLYSPEKVAAKMAADEAAGKIKKKKKSKFMEKMLEAQKAQLAQQGVASETDETIEETPEEKKAREEKELKQKEINRKRLAEARRRQAEKYGETYIEDPGDEK